MTLADIINKINTHKEEISINANHKDRNNITEELMNNKDWKEAFYIPSRYNTWRLFRNVKTDDTISINSGEGNIYDTIVINGK